MNTNSRTETPDAPKSSAGMRRSTGRDRAEWFEVLDAWGAAGRPYREIADWLTGEHQLSNWWAQKLIVEYEEARGIRPPGVRKGGTFSVGASKSIAAPVDRVVQAFVDPAVRERWLPGAVMHLRSAEPHKSARFDWADDGSRLNVGFESTGAKTQVAIDHEKLPGAGVAQETKAFWRERLELLKDLLEA